MTDDRTPGADTPPPAPTPPPATPATAASNLMNFARGAKGIALLCFLLPWVTVSCAGQRLASISGAQLATGSIRPPSVPAGGFGGGAPTAPAQDYGPDILVLIAAVLIVAALVVTFVMPRRRATLVAMGACAVAAALIVFDVFVRIKGAVEDQIQEGSRSGTTGPSGPAGEFERQMQQQAEQMAQAISVDPAIGFWLTVIALTAAIVLNNMVRSRLAEP